MRQCSGRHFELVMACLEPEAVQAILDGATMGISREQKERKWSKVTNGWNRKCGLPLASPSRNACHQLDSGSKRNPELDAVRQWLGSRKKADLRTLLRECIMSEEGWMVWRNHQNFMSLLGTLYLCSTPKGENEDLLLFVVPKAH